MAAPTPATASQGATIGPWIVSILALVQVWVIALVKWLRRPRLEIFESGNIEIGFGGFGATLALMGTLRVLHKDAFIKRVHCRVTRAKDGATHIFNWRAFRGNTIDIKTGQPPNLEIATSFLLPVSSPLKFNIFFVDEAFLADLGPRVAPLIGKWHEFKRQKVKELEGSEELSSLLSSQFLDELLFEEFSKLGGTTEEYTLIDRAFYWEPGQYRLELLVEGEKPSKVTSRTYGFTLSEGDSKMLRLNTITVLRMLCGFNDVFSFAYAQYEEA